MLSKKLAFFVLIALVSHAAMAQKTINKEYSGIKEIEISTASGDCDVIKSTNNKVSLELTYSYDDDRFEPVFEQDGDLLILKEKFKKNSSGSGSSNWQLSVPDNIKLTFNSGSGNLDLQGLNLEFSSNTGSGDIDLKNLVGEFSSNSGSGEVRIDGYKGKLKINTGSGDVELTEASGNLNINLGSGDIDASRVDGSVKFNAGSGDITVSEATITASSSVNAGSGDTKVILKSELKANLSLNSGSGNATLDFNGLGVQGVFIMKANKKHGEISAPFDFDSVEEEGQGNQTIVTKKAKIGSSDIEINIGTGSGRASVQK